MSSAGIPTQRLVPPSEGWDYQILQIGTDSFFGPSIDLQHMQNNLNQLGSDGWELANTIDINRGNGRTSELIFIFKRPSRQPASPGATQ
jgi:hypothetical protein